MGSGLAGASSGIGSVFSSAGDMQGPALCLSVSVSVTLFLHSFFPNSSFVCVLQTGSHSVGKSDLELSVDQAGLKLGAVL